MCLCKKSKLVFLLQKFQNPFLWRFLFFSSKYGLLQIPFLFLDVLCAKLVVAICEFFWAKLLVLVVAVCSSKNYNSLSEKGPTSTSHKSNLSTNKIELPNCLVRHGPNQNRQENRTSKPSKLRFCNQNGNTGGPRLLG